MSITLDLSDMHVGNWPVDKDIYDPVEARLADISVALFISHTG